MKRLLVSLCASTLLLAGAIAPAAAQAPPDPLAALQQLIAAVNRGDVPAQVAAFTDDAIFIGGPCNPDPCVGRAALHAALSDGGGEVQLGFTGAPEVSGNVVRFRLEQRFPLPPELSATGSGRIIELGTAIVSGGRISHLALVPDVTDAETMALVRLFASFGPNPAVLPDAYIAEDGQTLLMQSAAVQIAFLTAYGDQAHVRWVEDHNAALRRQ